MSLRSQVRRTSDLRDDRRPVPPPPTSCARRPSRRVDVGRRPVVARDRRTTTSRVRRVGLRRPRNWSRCMLVACGTCGLACPLANSGPVLLVRQSVPRETPAPRARGCRALMTPNPNRWSHYLRAISTKIEIISTTNLVILENSSDLSSGRRPVSESEEFSKITKLGIEIWILGHCCNRRSSHNAILSARLTRESFWLVHPFRGLRNRQIRT